MRVGKSLNQGISLPCLWDFDDFNKELFHFYYTHFQPIINIGQKRFEALASPFFLVSGEEMEMAVRPDVGIPFLYLGKAMVSPSERRVIEVVAFVLTELSI